MSSQRSWPTLVSIVSALTIFVGTYYAYAERHRLQQEGSYVPGLIGLGSFIFAMSVLTDRILPEEQEGRILKLAGIVAIETFAFFALMMLLILNTIGS